MKTVAVTGPIAGGKSTFTRLLAAGGAAVLDGDALGHEVLEIPEVKDALIGAFGPEVVRNGQVDRKILGDIVFSGPDKLRELNAITHEALADLFRRRLDLHARAGAHDLAVLEAAVYYLLPSPVPVDMVVTVTAPADIRLQRLLARNGSDPVAAAARIDAQADMERGWASADLVVVNDGEPAKLEEAARRVRSLLGLDP
ncbi:dephospho-CoA kinase [bacterium]|nr:dephospho-CoA kinase [bacterium]